MRIKRGKTKHQKHKKVLSKTKGFRLSYSKLYKRAKEALLHAGQYSFQHRKKRAGQFRKLWIKRISAGLTKFDIRYSDFMSNLTKSKIELNRKSLAALALDYPEAFEAVVKKSQSK